MGTNRDFVEVFLVPGFLGFQQLGDLPYFIDVADVLCKELEARGVQAKLHAVDLRAPAGSLRLRTAYLAKEVATKHSPEAKSVHFIGHSTGGLDIRLLLSPDSTVESGEDLMAGGILDEQDQLDADEMQNLRDALEKTRSAVSVATPHRGTPIANAAMRVAFDRLLRGTHDVLDGPTAVKLLAAGLRVAKGATSIITPYLYKDSFLRWIVAKVLSKPPESLIEYIQQAGADVGALRNLTQEGMDVADALLVDRPSVHYGSIITGTQEPGYMINTWDVFLITSTLLFWAAWYLVARKNPDYPYAGKDDALFKRYDADRRAGLDVGELDIGDWSSDGIVPTRSQAYGEILGVFASDHLDCVGHYPHTQADDTEVPGWVRSGAEFNDARFGLLWSRVGDFIASHASLPAKVSPSPPQDRV